MQNGTRDDGRAGAAGGADGGSTHDDDGPVFPHADDIEIPADLTVEAAEPAGRSADPGRRHPGGFASRLSFGAWRMGVGLRGVIDRVLLVATFVVPVLILAYQSFEWLRLSRWPSVTLEGLLASLAITPAAYQVEGWSGLNGLLDLLLEAPLAAVLFVAGLSLHLLLSLLLPSIRRD